MIVGGNRALFSDESNWLRPKHRSQNYCEYVSQTPPVGLPNWVRFQAKWDRVPCVAESHPTSIFGARSIIAVFG